MKLINKLVITITSILIIILIIKLIIKCKMEHIAEITLEEVQKANMEFHNEVDNNLENNVENKVDNMEKSQITTSKKEIAKNIIEQKMVYYIYTGKPIEYEVITDMTQAFNQKGKNPFIVFYNKENDTMMHFCGRIEEYKEIRDRHKAMAVESIQPFEEGSNDKWEIRLFPTFNKYSEALDYYRYIKGYEVNTYYDLWRN